MIDSVVVCISWNIIRPIPSESLYTYSFGTPVAKIVVGVMSFAKLYPLAELI